VDASTNAAGLVAKGRRHKLKLRSSATPSTPASTTSVVFEGAIYLAAEYKPNSRSGKMRNKSKIHAVAFCHGGGHSGRQMACQRCRQNGLSALPPQLGGLSRAPGRGRSSADQLTRRRCCQ
jgi:hypothetical protein